jgi:hypothetical protein
MNTKTTPPPRPATVREITENSTAQVKESYEMMSAAAKDASNLVQDSYSKAVRSAQEFTSELIECVRETANTNFDLVQRLCGITSPHEFIEVTTEHARKQIETLTEQSTKLASLGQSYFATSHVGYFLKGDCSKSDNQQEHSAADPPN